MLHAADGFHRERGARGKLVTIDRLIGQVSKAPGMMVRRGEVDQQSDQPLSDEPVLHSELLLRISRISKI